MKEFNFKVFIQNIESDIKKASDIVNDIEHWRLYSSLEKDMFNEEKHNLDELLLEDYLDRAIIKIRFVLEYLDLHSLLENFNNTIKKYSKNILELYYVPYIGILASPVIDVIDKYLSAIKSQIELDENSTKIDESHSMLERILIGTPKIISDYSLNPNNESEIRNVVFKMLIHIFPDTVREIPISKISKVYRPDIGIRKLKTAIEYKFAASAEEMKKCIGGIFEDIQGYEGSEDWTNFYAVIYQTDHFMTQSQVDEEFKLSKVKHNWKPILVYGKGERIKKGISKAK